MFRYFSKHTTNVLDSKRMGLKKFCYHIVDRGHVPGENFNGPPDQNMVPPCVHLMLPKNPICRECKHVHKL